MCLWATQLLLHGGMCLWATRLLLHGGMCLSEQVPIPDLSDCLDRCPRKETGRGFTEFRRQDHCPEKDLWMLHKQVTPQDVTDTTKMSQTCGYVGNEKLLQVCCARNTPLQFGNECRHLA